MDVALAQTFLAVAESGSFIAASERLHLTQTAVSARIRALEEQLDQRLFVRNKAGARPTPAGERFLPHAAALVQTWERARRQVALPPGVQAGIGVGVELALWHPLMADWMVWMHQQGPAIAVRADVDQPKHLIDALQDGALDLAVLYNPPQRLGLVYELLQEEKLVMVSTQADGGYQPERYVHVDWGPSFVANLQAAFPDLASPRVSVSLGPLALTLLLSVGGAGYFRLNTVQPFLDQGLLCRVAAAPEFSHSAYAVYAQQRDDPTLQLARSGLRHVAEHGAKPGLTAPIAARPLGGA